MEAPQPELVLAGDINLANLANILKGKAADRWHVRTAPLGSVVDVLTGPVGEGASALVWTSPQRISAAFAQVLAFGEADVPSLMEETDRFASMLLQAGQRWRTLYVPLWQIPAEERFGSREWRADTGVHALLLRMNARLVERLGGSANVHVMHSERWVQRAGQSAWSAKLWYLTKTPFSNEVFLAAAEDLLAHHDLEVGRGIKLVVLDLDDTLWGGIVGDDGWENLRLGGHDAIGEAFADFQRTLKRLKERGIMLAIASKNDAATALEAMDRHPEMVLRREDFVAMRIDWNDKPGNIADIIQGLNIGPRSVLFIDDNPVERSRVREFLPEVMVPEWPANKLLYAQTLRRMPVFELAVQSQEDARRTELYREEEERSRSKAGFQGVDDWLRSLDTTVLVKPLDHADLARVHQLFNKTNQFNLTTRRWTEQELRDRMEDPRRPIWSFRVSDRFGDAGLTGILGLDLGQGEEAVITDLVMSCRVMGRRVEETLLHVAVSEARTAGKHRVKAVHIPTAKNKPCLELMLRSGFEQSGPHTFIWSTEHEFACPATLTLHHTAAHSTP